MSAVANLEAAVAFAERERAEAYEAFRRALRDFTEADLRLLSARLDLSDAIAERDVPRPTDTIRKTRP